MKIRIRWYQGFILLAIFDAFVILFALEVHRDMVGSVEKLMDSTAQAEDVNRLCRRIEQCILELNAPGNDVFVSGNARVERRRLEQARAQLDVALHQADESQLNTIPLKKEVDSMVASAREVFDRFEKSQDKTLTSQERERFLKSASEAMAHMDARQIAAIRNVGILVDRSRDAQKTILDEHEASLQSRVEMESYFIGFIGLLLFGLLWFGYRLHKVDQELEAQRRLAEEERRERLAAIGELCSSVAHGIRNPLAAIRSSAQLTLELGKLDESSRSRLKDILSEGARLGDRVTGLLSMARATSGQFEDIDLQDIIYGAVKGLAPELERLGLALRQDVPDKRIRIKGDRRQLEQLVIELISNAMEYSPRGAQIVLRCDRPHDNGNAQIVIEDAGPGVPAEVRERVFDLFFTTKPSGTGIGLATVKRIARMHQGDVELTSSPRGGACFTVTLPTSDQAIRERKTQEEGKHA
jgi:signal transduction histidine kinase